MIVGHLQHKKLLGADLLTLRQIQKMLNKEILQDHLQQMQKELLIEKKDKKI